MADRLLRNLLRFPSKFSLLNTRVLPRVSGAVLHNGDVFGQRASTPVSWNISLYSTVKTSPLNAEVAEDQKDESKPESEKECTGDLQLFDGTVAAESETFVQDSPREVIEDELFKPFTLEEDPAKYQEGTFQYLFEKSKFVQSMDPVGKEVEAEIIAVVGDKLYVDFGCKFHAVVPLPEGNRERYCTGAKVIVVVRDVEVTGHFIGDNRHHSLLEAEAELVRLVI